jgi:CobQ-like glutamine amidotransferase family enzyme
MEELHGILFVLLVSWGAVTAALILLLIYRGTLESREDDQIFLDVAGESMASEQRIIVARINRLSGPIRTLIIASSVLLVICAGIWLQQVFKTF